MADAEEVERALKAGWTEWVASIGEPEGPGIRCPGCGALPDEMHDEKCPERDPGPMWPGNEGI